MVLVVIGNGIASICSRCSLRFLRIIILIVISWQLIKHIV